jgi:alpha-galactosidase
LEVSCDRVEYDGFPAVEWLVSLAHTGQSDTPIIQDVQACDIVLPGATPGGVVLHHSNGAPSNETDFEMHTQTLSHGRSAELKCLTGRSSNEVFPFFRFDANWGSAIVAVGWSGQWQARFDIDGDSVRLRVGLEHTHFLLHPGERVRGPRMLTLLDQGEASEANNVFRRLLRDCYCPKANRKPAWPLLFCNTCFTRRPRRRENEHEASQRSLIRSLAPLGAEAVITDSSWFLGNSNRYVGNWRVDTEKYPRGMAPVAAEAHKLGVKYGVWFEPERAVADSELYRQRPEWILKMAPGRPEPKLIGASGLLNFGLGEVQEYFFNLVDQFLQLPGFEVYRQDFNHPTPLYFWRDNDLPDRQGICEMKYFEGLYAYWDRIRRAHPDVLMEECAGGGRRIDLETVMRFQIHQKSDHWFDNVTDQASLFAISHYLPNGVVDVPVGRLDDLSFHSTMTCSLILGWPADDPDFDTERAKDLTNRYQQIRPLLWGDFYPLTNYSRDDWLAMQYHRGDLEEGMVLAFRREGCESATLRVRLAALSPDADYKITDLVTGHTWRASGQALADGWDLQVDEVPGSVLLRLKREGSSA